MKYSYTITHDGSRWYDFPYTVNRDGTYVRNAMTMWGARRLVKCDRRKMARGERLVWKKEL